MDFTPLEKDMNIISALDDEPNDVGGLTATEPNLTRAETPSRTI